MRGGLSNDPNVNIASLTPCVTSFHLSTVNAGTFQLIFSSMMALVWVLNVKIGGEL